MAPAPQAVRAASRVNIRMLGMAYTGSEAGAGLVWRQYDVCETFAASLKTALESQLEPFSPIEVSLDAGRDWGRPEVAGFGSGVGIDGRRSRRPGIALMGVYTASGSTSSAAEPSVRVRGLLRHREPRQLALGGSSRPEIRRANRAVVALGDAVDRLVVVECGVRLVEPHGDVCGVDDSGEAFDER